MLFDNSGSAGASLGLSLYWRIPMSKNKTQETQEATQEAPEVATWTYTVDGSVKTRPARLDGWKVRFRTIPQGASLQDAAKILGELSETHEAGVNFLRDAIESAQAKEFDAWTKQKAREDGKTYTRDEIKALPQRSAVVTKEDAATFGAEWKIPAPKEEKVSKTQRMKAQLNAAQEQILAMLRKIAEIDSDSAEEQLKNAITAGIVPADTTL